MTPRTSTIAAALVLALAHPGAVGAQAKAKHTYTRKQAVTPQAALSDRAKPSAPKPAAAPGSGSNNAPVALDGDTALSLEGLRTSFREEQEEILKDLIQRTPLRDAAEKANLYFMLGELYAKQHRFYRLKAQEQAIAKSLSQAASLSERAQRKLVAAIETYKELFREPAFQNYGKLDQALFYFGYMLKSAGRPDDARAAYDRLLKNHPQSKYVPEAHLVFGDYFFERGDYALALDRYRLVLKFPKSPVYWYAMYRAGWISLHETRAQEALELFYAVAQATRRDAKQAILFRASKQDYVRAYAEVGKAELAYNAFARVDADAALDMQTQLADHYADQGKSGKAIVSFQDLMKRAPKHARVCLWQYGIAQATLSLPGASNADRVSEIANLVRLHAGLAAAKALPRAEAAECRDNAAAMAGDHARSFHAEFAKTQDPATLAHADRLYLAYLDGFPGAPDHAQTQFFYAELLWSRALSEKQPRLATELWQRAAGAFTRVVQAGKVDAALRKDAAYATVLAWKNALDIDPRPKEQAGPISEQAYETAATPRPIPEPEQKLLSALELYITYVRDPDDDELVRIKFLKANLYRRYDHFAEAIPLLTDLLAKHRKHEVAETAAQLLLDSYNRVQRHDEMLAAASRLAADTAFLSDKPELERVIARLHHQALEKQAEALGAAAKAGNDFAKSVACGQAYMAIYNRDPLHADNDRVLYNAMVCFHQGKSIGLAIVAFELLEKYYPKSTHLARALALVGQAYADSAFYDKAATVLERYARKYAGETNASAVMSNVVFFNKGLGDDAKAISNTKYFVDQFGSKQPAEAATAMFSLASVYEKRGDTDGLVRHLRAYLARFGETGGADRRVIAHAKIGLALWAASCPAPLVDGVCVKVARARAIARRDTQLLADKKRCGDEANAKLTVLTRDARRVRDAMAAFAAASAEWTKAGGKPGGDEAAARHYLGQSKLAEADRDYESFAAVALPTNLDFHKAAPSIQAKSLKRFEAWLTERRRLSVAAAQRYEAVRQVTDNASSIAAVARLAQIDHSQADALYTTEIPLAVRTGRFAEDKIEAFCDRMDEFGRPLEEGAIRGYQVCLEQSRRIGWYGDWSRLCERELGQLRPADHPQALELRADPAQAATILVAAPAIRRLE